MLILIETLILFLGFLCLSLSLSRHYNQVAPKKRLSTRNLWLYRISGYILLLLAGIYAVYEWGFTLGLVYWCAIATIVSLLITLTLTFKPRWLAIMKVISLRTK
ncbi:DUF3325 domain-containing protein [Thalassotalea profundi]|uniref:DUF3325 domain-containing protein n=1 Tax=Thalassotalea profundi TaxID=2036687 RepID=A0ABQ3J1J4_9GAMM|nr:hypothetical protein GCM10011501_26990 [Thalassotalea profundi]